MFVYSSNIEVSELPFCVHLSAVYFLLYLTLKVYPIECCFITGFFRFSALSLLPCVQMSIKKPLFPEYSKQPQGERHLQLSLFFFFNRILVFTSLVSFSVLQQCLQTNLGLFIFTILAIPLEGPAECISCHTAGNINSFHFPNL